MSTTAIERREAGDLIPADFDQRKLNLLRQQLMPNATDGELGFYIAYCQASGLDPVARQIFPIRTWDKDANRYRYEFHIGVDGLRLIAARTGLYEGQEGPYWCGPDGKWVDVWLDDKASPKAAKVTVFRAGAKPVTRIARWKEFARIGRNGLPIGPWSTHPAHMIALAAERHALRAAFPKETMGHNVDLELDSDVRSPQVRDPEAPATDPQKGKLHQLAAELGWDDDSYRGELERATGKTSSTALTKGEAHSVIDRWTLLLETGEIPEDDIVEGELVDQDSEAVGTGPVERAAPDSDAQPGTHPGNPPSEPGRRRRSAASEQSSKPEPVAAPASVETGVGTGTNAEVGTAGEGSDGVLPHSFSGSEGTPCSLCGFAEEWSGHRGAR